MGCPPGMATVPGPIHTLRRTGIGQYSKETCTSTVQYRYRTYWMKSERHGDRLIMSACLGFHINFVVFDDARFDGKLLCGLFKSNFCRAR